MAPRASVLMPCFAQGAWLPRALGGLLAQSVADWELVVIDDGSPEPPSLPDDPRIRIVRHPENRGLGAALNSGLRAARAPVVAYLPADDLWFADHLASLLEGLDDGAALAYASLAGGDEAAAEEDWLELVQVAHRRTRERWTERSELESADLGALFWDRLAGERRGTGLATCRCVAHPGQRRAALREARDGGVNVFRRVYGVREPLRLPGHDEVARYARWRERALPAPAPDGLRILLAGELAYNPDRVLALVERGHRLSGAWTPDGLGFNTVGPLPFGGVEEVGDWREALRTSPPDVVYGLLNWRAVPFLHAVRAEAQRLGIPFVLHFKESPQRSLLRGEWPLLADLACGAEAFVASSAAERDHLLAMLPGRLDPARCSVIDGDLPKREWLEGPRAPARLSEGTGAPHVALLGRPVGLAPEDLGALAAAGVHSHLHGVPGEWARAAGALAPGFVHVEAPVAPADWVPVLSRYDAGWLHGVGSANEGDVRRATWDDLNLPARLPTLMGAGLPPVCRASPGHLVAARDLVNGFGAGLLWEDSEELVAALRGEVAGGGERGAAAWAAREQVTFDAHADALVATLRAVVEAGATAAG